MMTQVKWKYYLLNHSLHSALYLLSPILLSVQIVRKCIHYVVPSKILQRNKKSSVLGCTLLSTNEPTNAMHYILKMQKQLSVMTQPDNDYSNQWLKSQLTAHYRVNYWVSVIWGVVNEWIKVNKEEICDNDQNQIQNQTRSIVLISKPSMCRIHFKRQYFL